MNDSVELIALITDGDNQDDRFAYKYTVATATNDSWAEEITVETLLSPGESGWEDPAAEDQQAADEQDGEQPEKNAETDVEIALATENQTADGKGQAVKKAVPSTEDATGHSPDANVGDNNDGQKIIGSGAPIKLIAGDANNSNFAPADAPSTGFDPVDTVQKVIDPLSLGQAAGDVIIPVDQPVKAQTGTDNIAQLTLPQTSVNTPYAPQKSVTPAEDPTAEDDAPTVSPEIEQDNSVAVFSGSNAAALNQLIANAEDGATILLADGVYTFDQCIVIDRSNVTLKGESEAGTILKFDFAPGEVCDGISVTGGEKSYLGVADSGVVAGNNSILFEGNTLAAGDTIYMFQQNTREWLDANGWQNVSMEDADHRPFREVILEVDRVEGDTVYFTHSIPYSMDEGAVKLNKIDLLDKITLSDFSVTYSLGQADPYDFSNTEPDYLKNTAVSIVGTNGASVERISITDIGSKALVIGSSIDFVGDDILVSGSHNKGGGGNGYGILLFESNNASLTNLDVTDTRHGFITSAWSAETDNYIQLNNTNRDTGFHGSPDRGNTVVVDNSVLDFDVPFDGNGGSGWTSVSSAGSNHAAIDPFAENTIEFGNAEGANRNDTIIADDSGAYINGKYGYDTLIGGDGEDYIVGGTRSDTMTGGNGSDTFLLRMGDALDTITDFEFGTGGDTLIISGNADIEAFDDLYIYTRDGDARVRYGYNSTVILEGVDVADIDPANFQFDPTGTITAEDYFGSDYGLV